MNEIGDVITVTDESIIKLSQEVLNSKKQMSVLLEELKAKEEAFMFFVRTKYHIEDFEFTYLHLVHRIFLTDKKERSMSEFTIGQKVEYTYWKGGSDMGGPYDPQQWCMSAKGKVVRVGEGKVLIEIPNGERTWVNKVDVMEAK
jgi:hypothetical protein